MGSLGLHGPGFHMGRPPPDLYGERSLPCRGQGLGLRTVRWGEGHQSRELEIWKEPIAAMGVVWFGSTWFPYRLSPAGPLRRKVPA